MITNLPRALRRLRAVAITGALSFAASASDSGVLLSAQPLSTNRNFRFSFQADVSQTYPVAVSSDLIHWSPLTNVSGRRGQFVVEDVNSTNFQQRYYHFGIHPTPVTNMVWIPSGSFTMGSPSNETGRAVNEGPQTVVTLTQGFWMGKYEVTQEEYEALLHANISAFRGIPNLPVDFATYSQGTNYCKRLSDSESVAGRLPAGWAYRLPTEAEWEYAARAGTKTPFGIGTGTSLSSTQANFDGGFPYGGAAVGTFHSSTTAVGSFPPNAWGLYDMHGNVWEWCQDVNSPYPGGAVTDPKGPADGPARTARGGNYLSTGNGVRAAKRDNRGPNYANFGYGFRVVLTREP